MTARQIRKILWLIALIAALSAVSEHQPRAVEMERVQ